MWSRPLWVVLDSTPNMITLGRPTTRCKTQYSFRFEQYEDEKYRVYRVPSIPQLEKRPDKTSPPSPKWTHVSIYSQVYGPALSMGSVVKGGQ